jgi:hypothetical protein
MRSYEHVSACLHVCLCQPYIPFPDHWPVFSPKDKIGDWLEYYTKVMLLKMSRFMPGISIHTCP